MTHASLPAERDAVTRLGLRYRVVMLIVAAVITVASFSVFGSLPYDDDPTDYMPAGQPEVKGWLDITKRFGALDMLMVGLEEPGNKPLSFDGLVSLARVTDALAERKADGIVYVRSLTNVSTLRKGGGDTVNAEMLVQAIPRTEAERDKLLLRILSDTQVPGSMVSRDLMSYIIMVRVDQRKDMAKTAKLVMDIANEHKGPLSAYFFGAPFISHQISNSVFAKLPWVVPLFGLFLFGVIFMRVRNFKAIGLILTLSVLPLVWWFGLLFATNTPLSTTAMNATLLLLIVAMVVFSRGVERWIRFGMAPFSGRVLLLVVAGGLALGVLTEAPLSFLVQFGRAGSIGLLAVALVGVIVAPALISFLPPMSEPEMEPAPGTQIPRKTAAIVALILFVAGLIFAGQLRFIVNPPDIFSKDDSIGSALNFFERRFGGSDFLQIGVKGDLRDPAVMARIMAVTDLMEGKSDFSDVRSVTQVTGFLAENFGGQHRIPTQRGALDNLYFFLEGNEDVRSLITDDRTGAMIAIRVPSSLHFSAGQWRALAQQAVERSNAEPKVLAQRRLRAVADRFKLTITDNQIAEIVERAVRGELSDNSKIADSAAVNLYAYMESDDAPFTPTPEEWNGLKPLLAAQNDSEIKALSEAIQKLDTFKEMDYPPELADDLASMLATRMAESLSRQQAADIVSRLVDQITFTAVPKAFITRARGIIADLMDKREFSEQVAFEISGVPAILPVMEGTLKHGMLWAVFTMWLIVGVFAFLISRSWRKTMRAAMEAALASVLTLAIGWLFGIEIDSASSTLYLLPPILGYLISPWLLHVNGAIPKAAIYPLTFAAALAAASLSLLMTDVLPVMRLGAVMANALAITATIAYVSRHISLLGDGDKHSQPPEHA